MMRNHNQIVLDELIERFENAIPSGCSYLPWEVLLTDDQLNRLLAFFRNERQSTNQSNGDENESPMNWERWTGVNGG